MMVSMRALVCTQDEYVSRILLSPEIDFVSRSFNWYRVASRFTTSQNSIVLLTMRSTLRIVSSRESPIHQRFMDIGM